MYICKNIVIYVCIYIYIYMTYMCLESDCRPEEPEDSQVATLEVPFLTSESEIVGARNGS